MKKIIGMLLIAAFLCGNVVGCGGATSKPASSSTGGGTGSGTGTDKKDGK